MPNIAQFQIVKNHKPLRNPHCIATLHPWIDVGNVGQQVINRMASIYQAKELARLAVPGKFYDFTRYRPSIREVKGTRVMEIPNTVAFAAQAPENAIDAPDLILLRMLEPHALTEEFNHAIVSLFQHFGVTRYILVGGMYDSVPHTRPLVVTGQTRNWNLPPDAFGPISMKRSKYVGTTSYTTLMMEHLAGQHKIETLSLIVHLPQYLKIQTNFIGVAHLLTALCHLYGLPTDFPEQQKAQKLVGRIEAAVKKNPGLLKELTRLETKYDTGVYDTQLQRDSTPPASLENEIQNFLRDVAERNNNDD